MDNITLPNGWQIKPLEQVVEIWDTLRKPVNNAERQKRIQGKKLDTLYPYYGATGLVGYIDGYLSDGEYILLGEDGAPFLEPLSSKAYIINGKAWVNNHAHVLKSKYNNQFLCYYLNYFCYADYVTGTTRLKLTQGSMKSIPVIVPPLLEQHRIVAKIEVLFSELDKGVAELQKVKVQLKIYRQAVLKEAFEGRLTKDWRLSHAPDVIECLKHIKKQSVVFKDISGDENELKLSIPTSWEMVRLGEIFDIEVGSTPSRRKPDYWNGSINWVSSGEVKFCRINRTNETITELGLACSSTNLQPTGTILLAMIGEGKTRGQAAILEIPAAHNQNTAAILVSNTPCSSLYLYYFLLLNYENIRRVGSGNNQKALNKERVKAIHFPFASYVEQTEIVQQIESRLSVCDKIEQTVDESLKKAEQLRQSILKQAFEGKLV